MVVRMKHSKGCGRWGARKEGAGSLRELGRGAGGDEI
jgi:hypothetical protein